MGDIWFWSVAQKHQWGLLGHDLEVEVAGDVFDELALEILPYSASPPVVKRELRNPASLAPGESGNFAFFKSPPSVLVSDLLWAHDDEHRPIVASDIVSRAEASQGVSAVKTDLHVSVAEREAAYLAARRQIFAAGEGVAYLPLKQKPPSNPVVARRMIVHALGKKKEWHDEVNGSNRDYCQDIDDINIEVRISPSTNSELDILKDGQTLSSRSYIQGETEIVEYDGAALSTTGNEVIKQAALRRKIPKFGISEAQKANIKKEQTGAAKRMFANALGYPSGRENSFLKFSGAEHNK